MLREACEGMPAYLVGGAVRDLLLGETRADLDVAVEGDVRALADALGGEIIVHERFETAAITVDGHEIDIARARAETYERPGALPTVSPASIAEDLARRDFTVNAMAVPLAGEAKLIDPHGGADDLAAGVLRVLHDLSFEDDPTRALRAARYAARLGLKPDPGTERLLRLADLGTVSDDRVLAELARIAAEEHPSEALKLIVEWGVLDLGSGPRLAAALERLFSSSAEWREFANRDTAILLAVAPGEHPQRLRQRAAKLAHHAKPGSPGRGPGAGPRSHPRGAGDRPRRGRRLARRLRRAPPPRRARDQRLRPGRGRRPGGPGDRARASTRPWPRSWTARPRGTSRSCASPSTPPRPAEPDLPLA